MLKDKLEIFFIIFAQNGFVAQLNRASDYGSEGYRFESYRGHLIKAFFIEGFFNIDCIPKMVQQCCVKTCYKIILL